MKNKILMLILGLIYLFVAPAFSQDSIKYRPFINSLKNTPKELFFSIGLGTSPAIGMFALSDKSDGFGRGVYLSVSAISIISLGVGVSKGMNEPKFKKHFWHYTFMSLGGVCDGISEELLHHYSLVKEKFPNMNDKFFDPSISWNNKYKNGDPLQGDAFLGSSTIFVAGTDAYHAFRGIKQGMWLSGLITFQKGKNFKYTLLEAGISIIVYTTAKDLTHVGLGSR